jgi:hypothetical protein
MGSNTTQDNGRSTQTTELETSGKRTILNSWKEIAAYIGRGVRTVQRYEHQSKLPVRRIENRDHSSVIAYSDEIDAWLNRRPVKERPYVRPTFVVLDPPVTGAISNRKLVLEVGRFNVLTAYSIEELYSTTERFEVDGFVVDYEPGDETSQELCESLKERHPQKPVFAVVRSSYSSDVKPNCVDYMVSDASPQELLAAAIQVLGLPRLG